MGYSLGRQITVTLWINKLKIGQKLSDEDIVQEELFDYKEDPLETKNLILESGYKKIYEKIKTCIYFFKSFK